MYLWLTSGEGLSGVPHRAPEEIAGADAKLPVEIIDGPDGFEEGGVLLIRLRLELQKHISHRSDVRDRVVDNGVGGGVHGLRNHLVLGVRDLVNARGRQAREGWDAGWLELKDHAGNQNLHRLHTLRIITARWQRWWRGRVLGDGG